MRASGCTQVIVVGAHFLSLHFARRIFAVHSSASIKTVWPFTKFSNGFDVGHHCMRVCECQVFELARLSVHMNMIFRDGMGILINVQLFGICGQRALHLTISDPRHSTKC